uniref:Isoform b of Zinc finger protein-like 1 homolog n=1 Tax=Caenorhabditis elegans TaxID=6239 RepID=Q9N4Y9-2
MNTPEGRGDLLHWKCFDEWAANFPATTAPAGYRCPCCSQEVFPPINEVSPLIEKLREQLKQSNWARAALGLPTLPELNRPVPSPAPPQLKNAPVMHKEVPVHNNRSSTPATHLEMEDTASYSVSNNDVTFARKKNYGAESSSDTRPLLQLRDADNEENKYKRRPTMDWMRGLWRAKHGGSGVPQERASAKKIALFVIFLAVLALITIIMVMKRAGYSGEHSSDPLFDPMANPNIRVAVEDSRLPHV